MDYKIRKLAIEAAKGNFKLINNALINKDVTLNDVGAATILRECCRIFVENEYPSHVNEEDLYQVLKVCIQCIRKIDDEIALNCVRSIICILKYFVEKENYKFILRMENILLPEFVNYKTDQLTNAHSHLSILVHNVVAKLSESNASDGNEQYVQLCMLSIRMNQIHFSALVNRALTYFKSKRLSETDVNSQYNYFLYVLQLIEESKLMNTAKPSDIYVAIIKIIEVAVNNFFKQNEFAKIRECINVAISKTVQICSTKQYSKLFNILCFANRLVIELTDSEENAILLLNNFKECFEELKRYCEMNGLSTEIQKTSYLLYAILRNLNQYYTSVTSSVWSVCMKEDAQIALYKLIGSIGHVVSNSPIKCTICSCKIKTNLYTAVLTTNLIGDLMIMSIKKGMNISEALSRQVLHYLGRCCAFIADMKEEECVGWRSAWSVTGTLIYNISANLYPLKHASSTKYFVLLMQNVLKFEGTIVSTLLPIDILATCLPCVIHVFLENHQFDKALMYAAIQILCAPDSKASKQWTKVKYKEYQNNLTENLKCLTVVRVLQQNESVFKSLYPELNLNLDNATKTKLLLSELAQYQSQWPSAAAIKAALNELYKFADLFTVIKALIPVWIQKLAYSHNDIIPLLDEIFCKLEGVKNRKDAEHQLYTAAMHVIKYFIETTKIRLSIAADMKKTVTCTTAPLPLQEIPKHPNDECDMVPSYTNLRLDEYYQTIKLLTEALSIFEDSISSCSKDTLIECNINTLVATIGYEFQLHCDMLQASRAWLLRARIAKLLNDDLTWLHSISHILALSDINSDTTKELLSQSDRIISKLNEKDEQLIWKTLTEFYINKSNMFFRNQKIEAGYEEYQEAVKCFSKLKLEAEENLVYLNAQLDLLHVRYLQLPCSFEIKDHYENSLGKFSKLFYKTSGFVKGQGYEESDINFICFEVTQSLVHMYRWMSLPRETRCYARDTVIDAQGLAVPLRTAHFLIYLAQADLQSARLDDCQVKLNGLSDILCLGSKKNIILQNEIPAESSTKLDEDVSELTESFAEIMLDCASNSYKRQELSGSPVFPVQPFKMPSFVNHASDCDCFFCMNVEYKNLVLMYITLEAELHVHRGNMAPAQACFNGALKLFRHINRRSHAFETNVIKVLSCYPFPNLKDLLCQSYCALLLSYGTVLLKTNNMKKAEVIYKDLFSVILEQKYENMRLYNEAHLYYLITILNIYCQNEKNEQKYTQIDTELTVEDNNQAARTPENKQSVVIFPTSCSPRPESPPKRRIRKIQCKFPEEKKKTKSKNDKVAFAIFTSPSNKPKNKKNHKTENNANAKSAPKTPAATFISPKTPEAIKTVKKNKILQQIPVPSPTEESFTDENRSTVSIDVIPASPDAYTPQSMKASSVLESRTKMLTSRIKKSTKKNTILNKEDEETDTRSRTMDAKNNVCKSLLNEMCASENGKKDTGVKKKTTRQKPRENTTGRATRSSTRNK